MTDAPLVIDVRVPTGRVDRRGPVVVVEPLYGGPAVSLALDAGWGSVEVAAAVAGEAPIPLVSYEQPPAGTRCRVRCDDLRALDALADAEPLLVGSAVNARPLGAMLSQGEHAVITFVVAPTGEDELAADSMWAAGMLVRILLEELDDRPSQLTDAAGMAVMIAQGAEDAATMLASGARWRRHLERGGHADDLRVASAIDTVGVVPRVTFEGDTIVARAWLPEP